MMLHIIGNAALRLLLLTVAVQLGLRLLRVRHPQLQLAAWTAVLAVSLAMPLLHAVPVTIPAPLPIATAPLTALVDAPTPLAVPPGAVAKASALPWRSWLTAGYAVVFGAMLLRLLVGAVLCWLLLLAARPVLVGPHRPTVRRRIRASAAIVAPVTVGSAILLPADYETWPAAALDAVLAHEQAHVAGGDFYIQLLSQLNRALFWFSPASWWLHRRLTILAELSSDDAAIAASGDQRGYAAILLDMAGRRSPPGVALGGVAMARPATVGWRIERILAGLAAPARVSRLRRVAVVAGVAPFALAAAVVVAGAAPPDAAAVQAQREPHTRIAIDPALLDAYAGTYKDPDNGSIMTVTRSGDHLMTHRATFPAVPEYPYSDHDFFLTIVPQQNTFVTDASGAAIRVVHHQAGRDEVLNRIGADAAGQELAALEQRTAAERAPHVEVAIDPKLLDGYVGTYELTPRLIFTVTRDGNTLRARVSGQQTFDLHPYGDRDFFYTIVAAQLTFVPGSDGNATALILHQNGRDQTARRVDPAVAEAVDQRLAAERAPHTAIKIDSRLIDGYVGRYRNPNLEITVSREGDQVFVQVTGRGRYPVYPFDDNDFFATIIPAQISFTPGANGKAAQLIRHEHGVDAMLNREE